MIKIKGDVIISRLIGIVIAVVVLVIVLVGLFFFYSGKAFPFFQWLPDFKRNATVVEGSEIIRYDIIGDKVQYYDGTSWVDFSNDLKFGDKNLNYEVVRKGFSDYFYNGKRQGGIVDLGQNMEEIANLINSYNSGIINKDDFNYLIKFNQMGKLSMKIFNLYVPVGIKEGYREDLGFSFKNFNGVNKPGDLEFLLVSSVDKVNGPGFIFILGLDDKFKMQHVDSGRHLFVKPKEILSYKGNPLLLKIFSAIKDWRNNVLDKPISIFVSSNDKDFVGPPAPLYVCLEFRDNQYLIANLKKNVNSGDKCGGVK